jgi:hypothetical protein
MATTLCQCTSYKATKINQGNISRKNEGLMYCLPQTALDVDVTIARVSKIKGPFAEYAEKLLGLKNVITQNQISYQIANINIHPENVLDTAHQYIIQKRGCLGKRGTQFLFDQFGNVSSLNNRHGVFKDSIILQENMVINSESQEYPNFFRLYADASQIEKIDTVYETIKTDTIVMSKPIIKRTLVTKTLQQRAEEAADYILKFRMKRYELITASQEIAYSKEAIEYMNNQLVKMENEYLELFTGITQTENTVFHAEIIPNESQRNATIPLIGFSEEKGVESFSETGTNQYSLLLNTLNMVTNDTIPAKAKSAIPYRNPELVNIRILHNGKPLPQIFTIPILQFGIIRYLPHHIKSLILDPKTGTISALRVK